MVQTHFVLAQAKSNSGLVQPEQNGHAREMEPTTEVAQNRNQLCILGLYTLQGDGCRGCGAASVTCGESR